MGTKGGSLAARATLAVVLMIGFYVLALGIAALLLYLPYAEWKHAHRLHVKLAVLCVIAAVVILWSVVPRRDHFQAPGPLLAPRDQPDLFAVLGKVADATGQALPSEVYLLRDVNAWVSSRGGWMGFGSRRIMGIGLPLLERLSVSELRGVIAHEFGHYHGGDVKLGPWIYKTRAAIGRTVTALSHTGSIVHLPFQWYGNQFIRITHAISRRQELNADALAAEVVGREAFVSGLTATHAMGEAFEAYWSDEVVPVLDAGYLPPIARGFSSFLSSPGLASRLEAYVQESIQGAKTHPFDTHPPTRERIAKVEAMEDIRPRLADDPRRAADLVRDVDGLERSLLQALVTDPTLVRRLKPIAWDRVGHDVWLALWRRRVGHASAHLGTMTPASAPTDAAGLEELGRKLVGKDAKKAPQEVLVQGAAASIAAATACLLASEGWTIHAPPGDVVSLRRGDREVRPFYVLGRIARGEAPSSEWSALHAGTGVSDRTLASAGTVKR